MLECHLPCRLRLCLPLLQYLFPLLQSHGGTSGGGPQLLLLLPQVRRQQQNVLVTDCLRIRS